MSDLQSEPKQYLNMAREKQPAVLKSQDERIQALYGYITNILENITDCFYALDKQWRLIYINKEAGKMKGENYREYLGQIIWEAFPSLAGSLVEAQYRKAMKEQVVVHFEAPSNVFPGIYFEIHAYPCNDGLCVYYRDITKEKRVQQQLEMAQKMEAIGRLAGGLAHDLNNQLAIITSLIDLRFQQGLLEMQVFQDFLQIRNTAVKAAALTRQILLFSRNYPQNSELINLNNSIIELYPVIQDCNSEKIKLILDLNKDLWPIKADSANVEQVLVNLSINARDAMPEGGQLTIRTENIVLDETFCRQHQEAVPGYYARLTFIDNGYGMNEQVLAHIFEPFFTTKNISERKGMGLSVVYGIIKSHNGWINVNSNINEGTCFELYFPAEISGAGYEMALNDYSRETRQ